MSTTTASHSSSSRSATSGKASASPLPPVLEVIDPCNRTGKITIPIAYVTETRGVHEQNRPRDAKDMSLCLLFQKGACKSGGRCHQIHVDPAYVAKLRAQAAAGSSCCALHGDFNSTAYLADESTYVEVHGQGATVTYRIASFGRTSALEAIMRSHSRAVRVNASKICRLHSQGRCKFGKDCKNIHLCPKATPCTPAPLPSFNAPTTPAKPSPSDDLKRTSSLRQELESCGLSSMDADTPSIRSASTHSLSSHDSPVASPKDTTLARTPVAKELFPKEVARPCTPPAMTLSSAAVSTVSYCDSLWSLPSLSSPRNTAAGSAPALQVSEKDFFAVFSGEATTSAAWH